MKNLILLTIFTIVFFGCKEQVIGDFNPDDKPNFTIDDTRSKKGVAYTNRSKDWSHKTSALGAYWMYSWGNELRDEIPDNVEFVPMFWGKGSVNDANINRIKQLIADGKVKYVLGFNEPDGAAQANMTVDEAIALWPRLEELGVPLGSPATVSPNNEWMVEFMTKAAANNLRVDFIAVHHYGNSDVMNMINKLKITYNAYKKPIWVTEFAVADWSASSPSSNRFSEAEVLEFMDKALPALDEIEWIHRYAWFDINQNNAPLYTSSLTDDTSQLTNVGQKYASHEPNANIGPGKDTNFTPTVDPDELVNNGGFETGLVAPWGGFKNGVSNTNPKTGNFCGQLQNHDASLFTVVDVTPGKTYIVKYSTRWASIPSNTFSPALRIEGVGGTAGLIKQLEPLAQTDQWTDYADEVVIPSGVTKMRFVFFKGQVNPQFPPAFIDDISVKEKK